MSIPTQRERDAWRAIPALPARVRELREKLLLSLNALDALEAEAAALRPWLAAISGALLDAGCSVGDETTYASAIREQLMPRMERAEQQRDAALEMLERCRLILHAVWDRPTDDTAWSGAPDLMRDIQVALLAAAPEEGK